MVVDRLSFFEPTDDGRTQRVLWNGNRLKLGQHGIAQDTCLALCHRPERVNEKPDTFEPKAKWRGNLKPDTPDVAMTLEVVV